MIPQTTSDDFNTNIAVTSYPSLTYKISEDGTKLLQKTDGLEALEQAISLILGTERYEHLIYSWNYGVEMGAKIGSNMQLSCIRIKDAICEALQQDDRIRSVDNFSFEQSKKRLHITFTVHSALGDTESEVNLNV